MCDGCGVDDCGCESYLAPYIQGDPGTDGQSAFQAWQALVNPTGSMADFLEWMQGDDGLSAYQLAQTQGYAGTLTEWLVTLTAYGVAVSNGYVGTQAEWLASLVGASGINGVNAYTLMSGSFEVPLVGETVTISAAAPETYAWAGVSQPIHITQAGQYRVVSEGSTSIVVMNLGHPLNAAPGTTIPDPNTIAPQIKVSPSGERGATGPAATPGAPGANSLIIIQDEAPSGVPVVGQETVIQRDLTTTPPTYNLWSYQTGAWVDWGTISSPSAQILVLAGNPNLQPSTFGGNGWIVIDNGTPNQFTFWQRSAPGVWGSVGSITGVNTSVNAEVFRVGKALSQPIPTGTTSPTTFQFELSSGAGFYNGGWWNGSMYDAQAGISANMAFILENLRIFRSTGAGETLDFVVDINIKGVSQATGTIAITSPDTEGTLPVITTGLEVMDATVFVQVTVTPSVAPGDQWYIDFTNLVFYNQT